MEKKEIKQYLIIALLAVIVCVTVQNFGLVTAFLNLAVGALKPMVLGTVIAYIFNIIMGTFEKRYFPKSDKKFVRVSRRPVCLALSFLITIAILALLLYIVLPEIANAFSVLYKKIPPEFARLQKFAVDTLREFPEIQEKIKSINFNWESILSKASSFLTTGVVGIVSSAVDFISALTSSVTNICLGVVFAIYVLIRKDKLIADSKRISKVYMKKEKVKKLSHIYHVTNDTFRSFIIGQSMDALILGSLCFIGMKILHLPYAAMSAALVGVTAFIPIVGAFIGAGVSAFIILTENPVQALVFLIMLVAIQQIEGNIVYPKVVGSSVGLPGIWVLVAVTAGGGLFGILGMIIGVPLTAAVYKLFFENLENKEREIEKMNAERNRKRNNRRRSKPSGNRNQQNQPKK
ncbi:MAG: AI-2E family transporter [Ruminococcus sp.]|nr:AI-2E family transporter [Ruminococcus sp.]